MPYRAERISGRCRSAGHPAPPSKQPPGQGAPYVSEGNVKIHNRQDGNNQKLWRVTMEYSKEDLMEAKRQILGVGENMGTAGRSCDRRYVPSHAGHYGGAETKPAFH